jgi:hypothetical protein
MLDAFIYQDLMRRVVLTPPRRVAGQERLRRHGQCFWRQQIEAERAVYPPPGASQDKSAYAGMVSIPRVSVGLSQDNSACAGMVKQRAQDRVRGHGNPRVASRT